MNTARGTHDQGWKRRKTNSFPKGSELGEKKEKGSNLYTSKRENAGGLSKRKEVGPGELYVL